MTNADRQCRLCGKQCRGFTCRACFRKRGRGRLSVIRTKQRQRQRQREQGVCYAD